MEETTSEMLQLLEHTPKEAILRFPLKGPLAFNISKFGDYYRISLGEIEDDKYLPYVARPPKEREGKEIEEILDDEILKLGEQMAYFYFFTNNRLYKKAVTKSYLPE